MYISSGFLFKQMVFVNLQMITLDKQAFLCAIYFNLIEETHT